MAGHGARNASLIAGGVGGVLLVVLAPVLLVSLLLASMASPSTAGACVAGSGSWAGWARSIAEDDAHGYSQTRRGGDPDYDCASLVWAALRASGVDVGASAFNTTMMPGVLAAAGFERLVFDRSAGVSQLQAGDIMWHSGHTEIYLGDGLFVGAHHDENGGIVGTVPGDQKGDEISVTANIGPYTHVFRPTVSSGQAVDGGSDATGLVGMGESQAMAWFQGLQGPGNVCGPYAFGQCTWWACMRGYRLGWQGIGSYWGNGQDWAASARAAGFATSVNSPVPGALVSFPAGVQGSSAVYGHVAVVERVDTASGTVVTSEKGGGVSVYSRRLPIVNGGTYILPSGALTPGDDVGLGLDAGASGACANGAANGVEAGGEAARQIARARLQAYGWGDEQMSCLSELWEHESNWRWDAENPSSGAYGIPQALPASKMSSAGADWKTNAATQIEWGLGYIRSRYVTPCGAWAFWQSHSPHWY